MGLSELIKVAELKDLGFDVGRGMYKTANMFSRTFNALSDSYREAYNGYWGMPQIVANAPIELRNGVWGKPQTIIDDSMELHNGIWRKPQKIVVPTYDRAKKEIVEKEYDIYKNREAAADFFLDRFNERLEGKALNLKRPPNEIFNPNGSVNIARFGKDTYVTINDDGLLHLFNGRLSPDKWHQEHGFGESMEPDVFRQVLINTLGNPKSADDFSRYKGILFGKSMSGDTWHGFIDNLKASKKLEDAEKAERDLEKLSPKEFYMRYNNLFPGWTFVGNLPRNGYGRKFGKLIVDEPSYANGIRTYPLKTLYSMNGSAQGLGKSRRYLLGKLFGEDGEFLF